MKSLLCIAALATSTAATADIGFVAAVELCRNALPDTTLIQIEKRVRDGVLVYEGDMYLTSNLTTEWEARFRVSDGASMGIDVDETDESDLSELQAIFAAFDEIQIDFAEALAIAQGAEPQGDPNKIEIDFEEGILTYKVEFNDDSFRVYVAASNGAIVQHHHGGDDFEDLATPAQMTAAVDAVSGNGLLVVKVEGEDESGADDNAASIIEVTQWNPKTNEFVLTKVDAATAAILSSVDFGPTSTQAEKIAAIMALLDTLNVSVAEAVAQVAGSNPGAGVHEVELKAEDKGLVYKVEIITSSGLELDVWVDASTGTMSATAAVNFVPADLNADGVVDGADLTEILGGWGSFNLFLDLSGDGVLDGADVAVVLGDWTA